MGEGADVFCFKKKALSISQLVNIFKRFFSRK